MKSFEIMKVLYLKFGGKKDFDGERKDSYFHFKQGNSRRDFCKKVIAQTLLSRTLVRDPIELLF